MQLQPKDQIQRSLFLYSQCAKNSFYIFKWLKEKLKSNICGTWNPNFRVQKSGFIGKESHCSFLYYPWLLSLGKGGVMQCGKRDWMARWMQRIHHLAHYRKLANPWLTELLIQKKSAFSYIDPHGLKEIGYLQRVRMSLFQCLPLGSLLSFLHHSAVPEPKYSMGVLVWLFIS